MLNYSMAEFTSSMNEAAHRAIVPIIIPSSYGTFLVGVVPTNQWGDPVNLEGLQYYCHMK